MRSLERRLQVGLFVSLVALMGALWLVGSLTLRELTQGFVASRLQHDAEALLPALEPDGRVRTTPGGPARVNPVFLQPLSGHYYAVRLPDGAQIASRSLWDVQMEAPPLATGQTRLWSAPGPAGQSLLVWAQGVQKGGRDLTIAVAEDIGRLEAQLGVFQWTFALISLGGLLSILIVQGWLLRRSFRVLEGVRAEVQRLGRGEVAALSVVAPEEVRPLVEEINHLVALLHQRLERSRNAVGNLAHALKAPLHLLMQQTDAGAREDAGRWQPVRRQAERIRQLMERELRRARLAGGGAPGVRFDGAAEVPDLVATLKAIYRDKALDIRWDLDCPAFGDREDMLELLGNLLDNAAKWTRGRIGLEICQNGRQVVISVEDDGPGLPPERMEGLTRRGARLDESVEGHGLGLAIVQDIVRLYGGGVAFDRSVSLGGLRVLLHLPVDYRDCPVTVDDSIPPSPSIDD